MSRACQQILMRMPLNQCCRKTMSIPPLQLSTSLCFKKKHCAAGRGGSHVTTARRPAHRDRGFVQDRTPGLGQSTLRDFFSYTRHWVNPSFSAARSRLRPMKISWFRRALAPHGRSGRPSKSMWTPWEDESLLLSLQTDDALHPEDVCPLRLQQMA